MKPTLRTGYGMAVMRRSPGTGRRALLPALVATGACGLAGSPASALQLGDIDVHSSLGQPLRASIAYALSPNEQLANYCIFLKPAGATMPGITQARLTVSGGRISIQGTTPLKEPIVSLGISVDCPYTANITRDYTLMVDPAPVVTSNVMFAAEPAPAPQRPAETARTNAPAVPVPAGKPASQAPIASSTSYRVRAGDSLSGIAARIDNRTMGLWPAVQLLYDANPDAFVDGDMNRLKAGARLTIPALDGSTATTVAAAARDAVPAAGTSATGTPSAQAAETYADFARTAAANEASAVLGPADAPAADPTSISATDQTADLRPGDISFSGRGGFVAPIGVEDNVAERTPSTTAAPASTPRAATPAANPPASTDPGMGITAWLAGAGTFLAGVLLLFGVRLPRRRAPVAPAPARTNRAVSDLADEDPTAENRALFEFNATEDTDSLDVDLGSGDGFRDGEVVELAQDFAFSTTRDLGAALDMELPAGCETDIDDSSSTDIMPARRAAEHTILDREILPSDDDDDDTGYDLSMIIDATEQRFGADSDVTAKELNAIPVDEIEDADATASQRTLNEPGDYQILEQDYENELTATQALNAEIMKAAEDLQSRLDGNPVAADTGNTARVEAVADDDTDINRTLDDLSLTAEQTAVLSRGIRSGAVSLLEEEAAEMAADDETIDGDRTAGIPNAHIETRRLEDMAAETDLTAALPSAENDETAELTLQSGRFKTGR